MHETSLASAIVKKVLAFAKDHAATRITQVHLGIGELICLQPEQLAFSYGAITRKTPLHASSLEIESIPTIVTCTECVYTGRPKYWQNAQWETSVPTLSCPKCGAAAEIVQGNECSIRKIAYAD